MKRLLSMVFVFSMLVSLAIAGPVYATSFEVRYTSYPEYIEEEYNEYYLNVVNEGRSDFDDVQVGVYIPDIDYYARSQTFDADDRDTRREMFFVNLVDVEPGFYPVRMSMYSDDTQYRRVKWTWVAIE